MEHKVGQRVKIKSLDWYNKNKDIHGNIECGDALMNSKKSQFCGKIVTISGISEIIDAYKIEEDNGQYDWTDDMIEQGEEHVYEITEDFLKNIVDDIRKNTSMKSTELMQILGVLLHPTIDCPEGYIFKDENGNIINATKIVLEKKKKEYPKTYEECCKVLGVDPDNYLTIRNVHCYDGEEETVKYERDLLDKFDSLWTLHICRDAYWKLYGEEMGLGKPWEPDWNTSEPKYVIACTKHGIEKQWETTYCKGFAFPTEEMRDAFYENFKNEIEICKELL